MTKNPPTAPKGYLLLTVALLFTTAVARSDKVLLKDVQALTLRKDRMTTHRRVAAVPQLKCVGGAGCLHHQVEVMRCENAGADYDSGSIQWTCRADVPNYFKLGATDVRCEGYKSSSDAYVLKGSCGVEYRLLLTEHGERKYGRRGSSSSSEHPDFGRFNVLAHKAWKVLNRVFYAVFFGLVAWLALLIVRSIMRGTRTRFRPTTTQPPRRPPFDGWGGGGGWFDGWGGGGGGYPPRGPPPPYTQFPPRKTGAGSGWRPGFWTGLFGGGAAGYYAGRQARNDRRRGYGFDHRDRGGMFGEGPSQPPPWRSGASGSSARRYSTGSSSSAGEMHTTTGFGGTSNR